MEAGVLELHSFVRQALATLSSSRDGMEITRTLRAAKQYLGLSEDAEHSARRREFLNTHYSRFLQALVSNLQADWLLLLPVNEERELLDAFFLDGPPDTAFLVMLDTVAAASPSSQLDRCVEILERFLQAGRMGELIWEVSQDLKLPHSAREGLLNKIAALPDHVANKLEKRNRAMFFPQNYYPLLGREMLLVLERISQRLKGGTDSSVSFVSQLLGKVCVQGHSDSVLEVLVPRLTLLTQSDCMWQRICWRLVEDVPERWMESVVSGVVRMAAGPEVLSRLLGSIVLKNKKAEFVLTHKFLLLQYHHKTSVLQSLLGYLAREKSRDSLLIEVLKKLLEVWGNRSAVRHTPIEQQVYVSKAIVISLGQLRPAQIQQHRAELVSRMTAGVECHLDSALPRVRRLGMVVAECVSASVDTAGHRLTFQYEEDDETREIQSLCNPRPLSSWECPLQPHRTGDSQTDTRREPADSGCPVQTVQDAESESELDSDDEFIPYDLSADSELRGSRAPVYVRDCLEVLLTSESPDRVEATLKVVENLIRKNPAAAREVSVELAKILLHLEDKFSIAGFPGLRQRALVAVTVSHAVPVTGYLTVEFYAVNYSLSQRLDILDVLALSAQELAQPEPSPGEGGEGPGPQLQGGAAPRPGDPTQPWKHIVEQRLRSKTRHFGKGPSRPEPQASPNRFGPVAGNFFFPLISNYDRPQSPYNFLAEEPLMLGRLTHTLAVLMYLAVNVPIAIHMGKALLGFTWALRYHPDTYVRQGTLFAVSSLLLSVPTDRLLAEAPDELLELRSWLTDVTENDPDDDCRRLGLQCLLLLENFRKKLGIFSE